MWLKSYEHYYLQLTDGQTFAQARLSFRCQTMRNIKVRKRAAYRPFCETKANCADPDQTPQYAAPDQGLYCLLTECSIRV